MLTRLIATSELAPCSERPRHRTGTGDRSERRRIGRTKITPKKSPENQVSQFVKSRSPLTAPAANSVLVPTVAPIVHGSATTSRIAIAIRRKSASSTSEATRRAIHNPASAWRTAPVPIAAAIRTTVRVSLKLAELSYPFMTLSENEPSQMPGQIAPPRASTAHRATPEAGQMIVAKPGGTASEMPM